LVLIKGLLGVQPHLIFIVPFVYIHVPLHVVVHLHVWVVQTVGFFLV
jgi:hypothetical protein